MLIQLAMSGRQHAALQKHLYPGDGLEAVALLLCGRGRDSRRERLVVRKVVPVPHDQVLHRAPDDIEWSVEDHVLPLVEEMDRNDLALVVAHCHPGGFDRFSPVDDEADLELFPSVHSWFDRPGAHGAVVMLPDGGLFGRSVSSDGSFRPFDSISVAGDDLLFFPRLNLEMEVPDYGIRIAQTFGSQTFARLRKLRIVVVGASGTGSIVIEQLVRTGAGAVVLIDDDRVEGKNLNRIVNARRRHAEARTFKVDALAEAIAEFGLDTEIEVLRVSLLDPGACQAVASADIAVGCTDTAEGRHVLNQICSAYAIPLFDVGVHIEPDGAGGVSHVVAEAHYIQPHGSSLLSREVFSGEELTAEAYRRTDPAYYETQRRAGYLPDLAEDRPAVMPLNALAASLGVNDLLARLHGFRLDPNGGFARQTMSLTHGYYEHVGDGDPCPLMSKLVGLADRWVLR